MPATMAAPNLEMAVEKAASENGSLSVTAGPSAREAYIEQLRAEAAGVHRSESAPRALLSF